MKTCLQRVFQIAAGYEDAVLINSVMTTYLNSNELPHDGALTGPPWSHFENSMPSEAEQCRITGFCPIGSWNPPMEKASVKIGY